MFLSTGPFSLKKHEDERCPPPQHPPAITSDTRLCRRRKCIKDSDCSSDDSLVCCYNGCIHSCQPRVDPPLAFDWLEETELKGLSNSTETTTATSLGPKSLMNAQVTPETIALPGGCFLNAQQYEHLRLFRKYQHVHSCTCSHGDVVCTVNVDKDRVETAVTAIDLLPASASSR
ncbi:unnamed protein product [Allacma fusca]|uniref:WAP domain-containing protein n=1 Tax=Allacma fusca TaxID=39272 RepID=A0A8J2NYK6_9HEXA|nr:unnamed protein product [Allacma fusca]